MNGKQHVEIGIERHHHALVRARHFENCRIARRGKTTFPRVQGIETGFAQQWRRTARQTLIQQEPRHAARSVLITRSSSERAA